MLITERLPYIIKHLRWKDQSNKLLKACISGIFKRMLLPFKEIYMLNSKGSHSKGAKVFWKWGKGKVKGTVKEVYYFHTIEKETKGNQINR